MVSKAEERRASYQIKLLSTEDLISKRFKLLTTDGDKDLLRLIEAELSTRPDFLPVR